MGTTKLSALAVIVMLAASALADIPVPPTLPEAQDLAHVSPHLAIALHTETMLSIQVVNLRPATGLPDPSLKEDTFSVDVREDGGSMLVPLREAFGRMGASVQWRGASQTAEVTLEGRSVCCKVGSKRATVSANGSTRAETWPVSPRVYDKAVFLPIRSLCAALGLEVRYDGVGNWSTPVAIGDITKHIEHRVTVGHGVDQSPVRTETTWGAWLKPRLDLSSFHVGPSLAEQVMRDAYYSRSDVEIAALPGLLSALSEWTSSLTAKTLHVQGVVSHDDILVPLDTFTQMGLIATWDARKKKGTVLNIWSTQTFVALNEFQTVEFTLDSPSARVVHNTLMRETKMEIALGFSPGPYGAEETPRELDGVIYVPLKGICEGLDLRVIRTRDGGEEPKGKSASVAIHNDH